LEHDSVEAVGQAADVDLHHVLRARARMLAAPLADDVVADFTDLVVFRIGGERYAIDAIEVSQAMAVSEITALPGVSAFYRGFISHQGTVYPLLDLRSLLGRESDDGAPPAEAILIAFEGFKIAICADVVESFEHIDTATIAEVHAPEDESTGTAIRGVTDSAIVVLDIRMLLADARLVVDDRPPVYGKKLRGTT